MHFLFRVLILSGLLLATSSTLRNHPHQLAYFNEASGGPQNGYRHLLGSNLDWGQDALIVQRFLANEYPTTGFRFVNSGVLGSQANLFIGSQAQQNVCQLQVTSLNHYSQTSELELENEIVRIGYTSIKNPPRID